MADVSILPFRVLCREYGASLAYTEQINALALGQKVKKALIMAESAREDKPLSLQLSGCSAKHIIDAANAVDDYDILDINMGCPSKKIVSLGYGSALLKEKEKLRELMTKVVDALDKPVTIKMRSGFKINEAPQIAKVLEESGVKAITLHARTQEQGYSGSADWNTIKAVKDKANIPIIGNGDITSPERAMEMLDKTGCDYVMIGRTAIKNPAIFKQCLDFQRKRSYEEENRSKIIHRYVDLCKKYNYDDRNSNIKMIAESFTKGLDNSAGFRNTLARLKTAKEILETFDTFISKQE